MNQQASRGNSRLPGQTLPMGAGESWALQGKPGGRNIGKGQNIKLSIVENHLEESSKAGVRKLVDLAGTNQDH